MPFSTSQTNWSGPGSLGHENNQVIRLSSSYIIEFHRLVVYCIQLCYGKWPS